MTGVNGGTITKADLEFGAGNGEAGGMNVSPKWLPPVLLMLAARPVVAADEVADYLSPETKIVVGIQLRTIAPAIAENLGPELLAQTRFAGFDPLKDLDEVIVTANGTGDNPPVLAVLHGRFDVERMGRGAKRYAGVPMIEGPAQAKGVMALLDATTAIAGDPALVRAAIDRRQNGVQGAVTWAPEMETLRGKYVVWGIGEGVESVERFQFGAAFDDGLNLTAELHVASEAEMEKLTAGLRMMEAMAKASEGKPNGTRFEIKTEGTTLQVALRVSSEELKKTFEAQRGTLEAAVKSRLQVFGKPAATPPEATVVTSDKGETLVLTLPGARR